MQFRPYSAAKDEDEEKTLVQRGRNCYRLEENYKREVLHVKLLKYNARSA